MADYQSQFTGPQIDQRLAAVTDKQDRLVSGTNIKTVGGQSILGSGDIPIQAGDTNAVQYVAQELTEAQKQQARANINAASLADIQDMDFVTATERPTASASTMGHIYLIGPDSDNNYERYYTQESDGTYSWVSLGSTRMDLSTYATKSEVSQLQHEVYGYKTVYGIPGYWRYNPIPMNLHAGVKYKIDLVFESQTTATNYLSITDEATSSAAGIVSLNVPAGETKISKDYTPTSDQSGLYFRSYCGSAQPNVSFSLVGEDSLTDAMGVLGEIASEAIANVDGISQGVESNAYVRYSDGVVVSSSSMRCYEIQNKNYKSLSVFVGFSDAVPAAIAFFGANGYMQSASVQAVSGLTSYEATVPEGCTIIRVTNRPGSVPEPEISLYRNNLSVMREQLDRYGDVTLLNNETVPSSWKYTKIPIVFKAGEKYYFEVSTTSPVSGAMYVYITPVSGSQDANSLAAVTIPAGAKSSKTLLVPSQDYTELYFTTYRNASTPNVTAKVYFETSVQRLADATAENMSMRVWNNPFSRKPLFHHLNVEGDTTVPSQSLPDIAYAKMLGFDVIEANVHICSDGVYLVKHGNNGALGSGLTFSSGSSMTSATLFSDVSSTAIREQVRYSSALVQNRTYIPTLDEFCAEVKRNGMKVLLQCPNFDVLAIARKYLTDAEIIAYNLPERGDFKGLIMFYGNASDGNAMLGVAKRYGLPFMFGWQDYSSKSESAVKSAVSAMHNEHCLVAVAYTNPNGTRVAQYRGVDVISSTYKELNPSIDLPIHIGSEELVLSSGATEDGGIINLPAGESVKLERTNNGATAVTISARYEGTLSIIAGDGAKNAQQGLVEVASDGGSYVTYSGTSERNNNLVYIIADANTTIYELSIGVRQII